MELDIVLMQGSLIIQPTGCMLVMRLHYKAVEDVLRPVGLEQSQHQDEKPET